MDWEQRSKPDTRNSCLQVKIQVKATEAHYWRIQAWQQEELLWERGWKVGNEVKGVVFFIQKIKSIDPFDL